MDMLAEGEDASLDAAVSVTTSVPGLNFSSMANSDRGRRFVVEFTTVSSGQHMESLAVGRLMPRGTNGVSLQQPTGRPPIPNPTGRLQTPGASGRPPNQGGMSRSQNGQGRPGTPIGPGRPPSLNGASRPSTPNGAGRPPIPGGRPSNGQSRGRSRLGVPQMGGRQRSNGVWCEYCNDRVIEFKRQVMRMKATMKRQKQGNKEADLLRIQDKLQLPESCHKTLVNDRCDVCDTSVQQLKHEAIAMVQSYESNKLDPNQLANRIPARNGVPSYISSMRPPRHARSNSHGYNGNPPPIAAQAQAYLEQNVLAWMNPSKYNQVFQSSQSAGHPKSNAHQDMHSSHDSTKSGIPRWRNAPHAPRKPLQTVGTPSLGSQQIYQSPYSQGYSAAASFFARAAQKLNISSKKKRKKEPEPEPPPFPTRFNEIIRASPPPCPPCLMRTVGRLQKPGAGNAKIMLKIANIDTASENTRSYLSVDPRKKQITVFDPSHGGYTTPSQRRAGMAAPKMFAFDQIFTEDDSLTEICSSSLSEIVQAVVNGADGCLFAYGHAKLGKTFTMIGRDDSPQNLGAIPCAIEWLFKLINEQKDKTGARFSVRVSAVEVHGKQEQLRDLLSEVSTGTESGGGAAPGVYLREDPISGTQLENQSELRAPTADKAAYYLDAALNARAPEDEDEGRNSHILFTLHVYQYRVDKNAKTGNATPGAGVAGGRSRLHLIDLGSCTKSKDNNGLALSLSALGNVIMCLLNGQRHMPHKESKLTQLVKESFSSISCRTCMIAHISPSVANYNETLQVIQLAARIFRMKRKAKSKFSCSSSDDSSSCDDSRLRRRVPRMGTLREDQYSSQSSDPDYTSSSEQSCDTVIYVGRNGQALSDRDLTDNESPPVSVPILPKASRLSPIPKSSGSSASRSSGSSDDAIEKLKMAAANVQRSPSPPVKKPSALSLKLPEKGKQTLERVKQAPEKGKLTPEKGMQTLERQKQNVTPIAPVTQIPQKANVVKSKPQSASKTKVPSSDTDSKHNRPTNRVVPRTNINAWPKVPPFSPSLDSPTQEQWIDGPGAVIYPEANKSVELWVDGPCEFRTNQAQQAAKAESSHRKQSLPTPDKSKSVESRRHSDEDKKTKQNIVSVQPIRRTSADRLQSPNKPKAFALPTVRDNSPTQNVRPTITERVRTDLFDDSGENDSEVIDLIPDSEIDALESCPADVTSTIDESRNIETLSMGKESIPDIAALTKPYLPLKNALPVHVQEQSRPDSMFSVDSGSIAVNIGESRPESIVTDANDVDQVVKLEPKFMPNDTLEKPKVVMSVKPFVRDWVEKHSVVSSETPLYADQSNVKKMPVVPEKFIPELAQSEYAPSYKSPMSVCEVRRIELEKEKRSRSLSPKHSPLNTPKMKKKLKKSMLPPQASSTNRTMEWVRSLSVEPSGNRCSPLLTEDDLTQSYTDRIQSMERRKVSGHHRPLQLLPKPALNIPRNGGGEDQVWFTQDELESQSQMSVVTFDQSTTCSSITLEDKMTGTHRESVYEMAAEEQLEGLSANDSSDFSTLNSYPEKRRGLETVLSTSPVPECISQGVDYCDSEGNIKERTIATQTSDVSQTSGTTQTSPMTTSYCSDAENETSPILKDYEEQMRQQYAMRIPDGACDPCSNEDTVKVESSVCTEGMSVFHKEVVEQLRRVMEPDVSQSAPSTPCHISAGRTIIGQSAEDQEKAVTSSIPRQGSKLPTKSKPAVPKKPATRTLSGTSIPRVKPPPPAKPPRTSSLPKPANSVNNSPPTVAPKPSFSTFKKSVVSNSAPSSPSIISPVRASSAPPGGRSSSKERKTSKSNMAASGSIKSSKLPTSKSKLPTSSNKTSTMQTSKESKSDKISLKMSKSKLKEGKSTGNNRMSNSRINELSGKNRATDSDSGVDTQDKKFLSPYHSMTKPRTLSRSTSSGHGSDNSSCVSGMSPSKTASQGTCGASSGYESMMRDSEVTGSSTHDSTSESSTEGRVRGMKIFKKKLPTPRRSRSAPPRPLENSPAPSRLHSPSPSPRKCISSIPSPRAWVDTRRIQNVNSEPLELKVYDVDDVERMQRRRQEDLELRALQRRRQRVQELLRSQEELKNELATAKERLMVDKKTWSYDLHVASQEDRDDSNYVEALEKETIILEKRVAACKSRIMMVTCFDSKPMNSGTAI